MSGPLTLAINKTWEPSVFRPPARFVKSTLPSSTTLSLLPTPLYPGVSAPRDAAPKEPRLVPPPALGQSPTLTPRVGDAALPLVSSSTFSPLSTPVSTRLHKFTQSASDKRVYPLEMFMSVRQDAAHTPYGVLRWAVQNYLRIPTLKVPPHLQLSLHEVVDSGDGVTRGALGCGLRGGVRARPKPVRLTRHKVMSILSRITPGKYDVLLNEMTLLPLRQENDTELMQICKIVFDKAVQEPSYSGLYARLAHDICILKDGERESESCAQSFSRRFCQQLITLCEEEFRRPLRLSPDDLVDRTTGAALSDEEVEVKRDRLKSRLVGNIRFVAELFKNGLVAERVIDHIISVLVKDYNPDEPTAKEEYVFEVFQTLVQYTGEQLKQRLPHLLAQSLGIAKTIELSHPKPRVKFLMMGLADSNRENNWVAPELLQRYVRHPKLNKSLAPITSTVSTTTTTTTATTTTTKTKGTATTAAKKNSSAILSTSRPAPMTALTENMGRPVRPAKALWSPHISHGGTSANGKKRCSTMDQVSAACSSGTPASADVSILTNDGNDESVNNNTTDVARNFFFTTRLDWRGQHQPYGNIVSMQVVGPGNDSYFNASNKANDFFSRNTAITSFQAGSDSLLPASQVKGQQRCDVGGDARATSEGVASQSPSGIRSPMTDTTVNMKEVTEQLMSFFRDGEEMTAITMLRQMELKNMVVCLTWWMRIATTTTAFFDDRSKVASLISSLLSNCGGTYDAKILFSTILEWIRFDVEKGEYNNCPRMFDNMAHMIYQCHLPCNDTLPCVAVVRDLMQCGLFNVLLRELTISGGTDQMVTAVKSCYPVSLQIMNDLHDTEDERHILRIAAQNRFRLLPYLLSVSSVTNTTMPGTPSMRPLGPSSPPLRGGLHGDTLASTGHYDPLAQCLLLQRVMDDTEFVLFRKLRDAAADGGGASPARWHDEAVQLALSPLGNNSTVCQLIAVMRVVGALLACSSVSDRKGRVLASCSDVDAVVGEILRQRPGTLYQGAVAMELVMYFTQTLNDTTDASKTATSRLRQMKRIFDYWCDLNILHRSSVLGLLQVLDNPADAFSVYAAYHDNVADVAWHLALAELRAR